VKHTQRVETFSSLISSAVLGGVLLWTMTCFIIASPVVRPAHVCLNEVSAVLRRRPGVMVLASLVTVLLAALAGAVAAAWLATQGGCTYQPNHTMISTGANTTKLLSGWTYDCQGPTFATMPWTAAATLVWAVFATQSWCRVFAGRAAALDMRRNL
jgi:hypothetical protein